MSTKSKKLIASLLLLSTLVGTAACGNKTGEDPAATTTAQVDPSVTTGKEDLDSTPKTEDIEPPAEKSLLPRQAAAEGMVLLKNEDNVLPLQKDSIVALFGKGQIDLIKGGTGSGDVRTEHIVGVLEGLETKAEEGKIGIYTALAKRYKSNSSFIPTTAVMKQAAQNTDTAIYVITRNSGEGSDRSATAGDYYLADSEISMIENLISAGFEDIVVILNVGGIVDTTKLLSYPEVKSILLAWQPGQGGGDAIADLLVGDVTPSGKLSDTFAKSYDDYPTSAGFHESADYVDYTEDIFVGYRYFETFDPTYSKVNFEFGFGLSYTTFDYSDITFTEQEGDMIVSVKVTNTGEYSGKEVVQLYFSAPQGRLGKPGKELCAFAKTSTLAPSASETVALRFDIADLSSYDDTGKVQKSAYVMEAGVYNFYIGNSIKNAGEEGVRYTYTVAETVVVEQLTEEMTAKLLEERLLADGTYENIFDDSNIGIPIGTNLVKIEAEAYYGKHCHAEVVFNSAATKSGIKMLTSTEGNRYVTFAVEAPESGNWRISLGIGNENGNISNAVRFYVNDVPQTGSILPLPDTRGFWTTGEIGSATVTLVKGLNFIRVEFVCGDTFQGMLDYITLEKG
ncbi:MAG: glycoside hydrolase family 3 C-terminal domain-containing protein, partial [Clostridia bacterium]|nr:glycoside hydrolase family 3 C-terminal domain-containing protein [Clostridia bacterium]